VAFIVIVLNLFWQATPGRVDHYFRRLQLVSSALYSLGHGTNDSQKTMGIIALLLFNAGYPGSTFYVPYWVILTCHAAIALSPLTSLMRYRENLSAAASTWSRILSSELMRS
jgi:inorganic phosphate transporter, PiT family